MIQSGLAHNYAQHEKLLYRWIGRDIENGLPAKANGELPPIKPAELTDQQRKTYLSRLEDALNPKHGLRARVPEEQLGFEKMSWKPSLPSLSFTELSLTSSQNHCRLYGRLGFAFTKQSILAMPGRPVAYIPGGAADPTLARLLRLQANIQSKCGKSIHADFEYLLHFYKRLRFQLLRQKAPKHPARKTEQQGIVPKKAQVEVNPHFPKTKPLPYLEEQEWRVVIQDSSRFAPAPAKDATPAVWFPIVPKYQLLLVVVPDNIMLRNILRSQALRDRLYPANGRPVQLISHEAIHRL